MYRRPTKSRLRHNRWLIAVGYACSALSCFFCGIRPLIKDEQKSAQLIPDEENGAAPWPTPCLNNRDEHSIDRS